ncbi:hypothetical protein ES705_28460 [subsurface metagenome]
MSNLPIWTTPSRQNYLVRLFLEYGNKCLKGHSTCPDISHYVYAEPKIINIAEPVYLPCRDREGNPLIDNEGNTITLLTYGTRQVTEYELKPARLYELLSERVIDNWKADDNLQRLADWHNERYWLHRTSDRRYPLTGQFSAVSRDIFFEKQPDIYVEGLGISGLTFTPFAKVRLPSSYIHLYIDIGTTLRGLSKNKRRKAIRYGKPIPSRVELAVHDIVKMAVRHYLDTR